MHQQSECIVFSPCECPHIYCSHLNVILNAASLYSLFLGDDGDSFNLLASWIAPFLSLPFFKTKNFFHLCIFFAGIGIQKKEIGHVVSKMSGINKHTEKDGMLWWFSFNAHFFPSDSTSKIYPATYLSTLRLYYKPSSFSPTSKP